MKVGLGREATWTPAVFLYHSVFEQLIGALPDATLEVPAGTWREAGEKAVFPPANVYWSDSRCLPVLLLLFGRTGDDDLKIVVTRVPCTGVERRKTIWPKMSAAASRLDESELEKARLANPHLKGLRNLTLDQVRAEYQCAADSDIDWSCWVRPIDSVAVIDCPLNSGGERFDTLPTQRSRERG